MDPTHINTESSTQQSKHSITPPQIKREGDSVDDFEHVDPEHSPVKEAGGGFMDTNRWEPVRGNDDLLTEFPCDSASKPLPSDSHKAEPYNAYFDPPYETKKYSDCTAKLLSEMTMESYPTQEFSFKPHELGADFEAFDKFSTQSKVSSHVLPVAENVSEILSQINSNKSADTSEFLKAELSSGIRKTGDDITEPKDSDFHAGFDHTKSVSSVKSEGTFKPILDIGTPTSLSKFGSVEEDFDLPPPVPPHQNITHDSLPVIAKKPEPIKDAHKGIDDFFSTDSSHVSPIIEQPKPDPVKPMAIDSKKEKEAMKKTEAKRTPSSDIGPQEVFSRLGLVEALIYWRDPKKSGPVFGGVLIILLSLTYFSLISVIAYISLLALSATIAFRIYKNVLQAVQKTSDGHPFKEYLEMDLSLPQEKVTDLVDVGLTIVNAGISELRRLFLVEDLIDSIKFGVLLWCLTYVGSWFNGMTLVIIAFIALFTLPKVYENNKAQIDANIEIVRSKLAEITTKVKAAIPMGKKEPEKAKEQ